MPIKNDVYESPGRVIVYYGVRLFGGFNEFQTFGEVAIFSAYRAAIRSPAIGPISNAWMDFRFRYLELNQ